jgi:subtilisin family serine protease
MTLRYNIVLKPIRSNVILLVALFGLIVSTFAIQGNYGNTQMAIAQNNSNSTIQLWSDLNKVNNTGTEGILSDNTLLYTIPNDTIVEDDFGALSDTLESTGANVTVLPNSGVMIVKPSGGNEDVFSSLSDETGNALPDRNFLRTMHGQTIPMGVDRIDADRPLSVNPSNSSNITNSTGNNPINATIGILDTGIDLDNPDLNVVGNVSFVPGAPTGDDDQGHGTHVAGIAAAKDNDYGVVGVAPGAKLIAIKVLDHNGEGDVATTVKGLEYVLANIEKFDVINISLGGYGPSNAESNAIAKIVSAGIPVVISSGNENANTRYMSPGNTEEAITVSAMYDNDGKCGAEGPTAILGTGESVTDDSFATYSNHGDLVDIMAPGTANSTLPIGLYDKPFDVWSGTSMAAPHVTGTIALIKAFSPDNITVDEIEDILNYNSIYPNMNCERFSINGNIYALGYADMTRDDDDADEPLLFAGIFRDQIRE